MAEMKLAITFTLAAIMAVAAPSSFAQTVAPAPGGGAGETPDPWAAPSWNESKGAKDVEGYTPGGKDTRPHQTATRQETVAIAQAIAKRIVNEALAGQGQQVPGSDRTHVPTPGSPELGPGTTTTGTTTAPAGAAPALGSATTGAATTPPSAALGSTTTSTTPPTAATGTSVPGPVVNNFITTAPAPTGGAGSWMDPDEVHREVDAYLEGILGPEGKKLVPKVLPLLAEELEIAGYHVPTQGEWDRLKRATAANTAEIARNKTSIAGLRGWADGIVQWGRRLTAFSVIALALAAIAIILAIAALRRRAAAPDEGVAERLDEFGGRLDAVEGVAADARRDARLAGRGALAAAEITRAEWVGEEEAALLRDLRAAFAGPRLR